MAGVGQIASEPTDGVELVAASRRRDEQDKPLDTVSLLLTRERARHQSELAQTRDQLHTLLDSPGTSLLAALDIELGAVAIATVEAMATLRQASVPPGINETSDAVAAEVTQHLREVADHTRSALALHLAIEAMSTRDRTP